MEKKNLTFKENGRKWKISGYTVTIDIEWQLHHLLIPPSSTYNIFLCNSSSSKKISDYFPSRRRWREKMPNHHLRMWICETVLYNNIYREVEGTAEAIESIDDDVITISIRIASKKILLRFITFSLTFLLLFEMEKVGMKKKEGLGWRRGKIVYFLDILQHSLYFLFLLFAVLNNNRFFS